MGVERELREALTALSQDRSQKVLFHHEVEWSFSPWRGVGAAD